MTIEAQAYPVQVLCASGHLLFLEAHGQGAGFWT